MTKAIQLAFNGSPMWDFKMDGNNSISHTHIAVVFNELWQADQTEKKTSWEVASGSLQRHWKALHLYIRFRLPNPSSGSNWMHTTSLWTNRAARLIPSDICLISAQDFICTEKAGNYSPAQTLCVLIVQRYYRSTLVLIVTLDHNDDHAIAALLILSENPQ